MNEIGVQGAAESRKKKIYDAVYGIEAEENRRAYAGLVEYKRRVEHVRLGVQAQNEELRRRDGKEETNPNYRVKQMRMRTRLILPFWETVRNDPPWPGERRPVSSRKEVHAVRMAEEMNEAMRVILEDRR